MRIVAGAIEYGREIIHYEVRFLSSRQTLGIEVHPDQRVLVRAPLDCPEQLICERVRKRAAWISRQIADFQRYRPRTPPRQYVSGETHLYLGRQYRLKVRAGEPQSVKMTRAELIVTLPRASDRQQIELMLHRWDLDHAREVLGTVLDACLPRFTRLQRPRLIVRAMRSRWGSLSPAGTMTLNANLLRAPRPCVEYVVIHELCHLKHRNHDDQFFRLLGRMMPDWEKRKQRLEAALI